MHLMRRLSDFFLQLKIIFDFGDFPFVLVGECNRVLDVFIDRSRCGVVRTSKTEDSIRVLCKNTFLYNIWKLVNPTACVYTFFSDRHSVYSSIDYFLVSHSLMETIGVCSIGTIVMTDYSPTHFVMAFGVAQERSKGWWINASVLQNEASCVNPHQYFFLTLSILFFMKI